MLWTPPDILHFLNSNMPLKLGDTSLWNSHSFCTLILSAVSGKTQLAVRVICMPSRETCCDVLGLCGSWSLVMYRTGLPDAALMLSVIQLASICEGRTKSDVDTAPVAFSGNSSLYIGSPRWVLLLYTKIGLSMVYASLDSYSFGIVSVMSLENMALFGQNMTPAMSPPFVMMTL